MNEINKLYKKYRFKRAIIDGYEGRVCGYDKTHLIIAVTEGKGWHMCKHDFITPDYRNNPLGYLYIDEINIIL